MTDPQKNEIATRLKVIEENVEAIRKVLALPPMPTVHLYPARPTDAHGGGGVGSVSGGPFSVT